MAEHYLDDTAPQPFWDNSVTPRLTIAPGDTVVAECAEPIGQMDPGWTHEQYGAADPALAHALTGSIAIDGAMPGDVLEIEVLDMQHKAWGWTGHYAGHGLLADEFDFPYIRHWEIDGDRCLFPTGQVIVPFEPFPGVVGVAPREPGRIITFPPRSNAGNVDVRDIGIGSTFWIPVQVPGALFAVGDCHSAQGDGESCGTAIESPMTVTLRFDIRRDMQVEELQIRRQSHRTPIAGEWYITTAHGSDLFANARKATRYMIDWITREFGLDRSDAYLICSVAGDLRISEIVDAPNWVVSMHLPLGIFT